MRTLLLATSNQHKLEELRAILSDLPFKLFSLQDLQVDMAVEETGATFAENAVWKARAYAQASGMLTLADDSGLEIDALGGAPGIRSARYLGRETTYEERFRRILAQLNGLPVDRRTARFRCAIALVDPSGSTRIVEGVIEGVIAAMPSGKNGFGYDPIFFVPELGKTTAELTPSHKNQISHRGQAAMQARKLLESWTLPSPSQK